jgi:hypothetical protein
VNVPRLAIVLACLLVLGACIDESRRSRIELESPWPEDGAPLELRALADDLSACQAATSRLPATLAQLDGSGVATSGPYATCTYAYHPTAIGVLRDGWRVLVADDRVRSKDHVWCIVRPPVRTNGSPPLRIVLVPMIELREAAAAAGGR